MKEQVVEDRLGVDAAVYRRRYPVGAVREMQHRAELTVAQRLYRKAVYRQQHRALLGVHRHHREVAAQPTKHLLAVLAPGLQKGACCAITLQQGLVRGVGKARRAADDAGAGAVPVQDGVVALDGRRD